MPATLLCDRLCSIHGRRKYLQPVRTSGQILFICRDCDIERKRRRRALQRSLTLQRLASHLASAAADRLELRLQSLVRSCGGWERLVAELPIGLRARVAVRLADGVAELRSRAEQAANEGEAAAKQGARDPLVIAAAVELLLQLTPGDLRPVLERLTIRARTQRQPKYSGDGDGV